MSDEVAVITGTIWPTRTRRGQTSVHYLAKQLADLRKKEEAVRVLCLMIEGQEGIMVELLVFTRLAEGCGIEGRLPVRLITDRLQLLMALTSDAWVRRSQLCSSDDRIRLVQWTALAPFVYLLL